MTLSEDRRFWVYLLKWIFRKIWFQCICWRVPMFHGINIFWETLRDLFPILFFWFETVEILLKPANLKQKALLTKELKHVFCSQKKADETPIYIYVFLVISHWSGAELFGPTTVLILKWDKTKAVDSCNLRSESRKSTSLISHSRNANNKHNTTIVC